MRTSTLLKGGWYLAERFLPESRAGNEKTETRLLHVLTPPNGGRFATAHVMDSGEEVRIRAVLMTSNGPPEHHWGIQIQVGNTDSTRFKHYGSCHELTLEKARKYCDQHHFQLPPEERPNFRSRIARFFGG